MFFVIRVFPFNVSTHKELGNVESNLNANAKKKEYLGKERLLH